MQGYMVGECFTSEYGGRTFVICQPRSNGVNDTPAWWKTLLHHLVVKAVAGNQNPEKATPNTRAFHAFLRC